MTPEEQNIAIAQSVGWKMKMSETFGELWLKPGAQEEGDTIYTRDEIPNYYGDLNACHEMEKVLDKDQRYHYVTRLVESNKTGGGYIFVTAPQRCESFLKVKGLWKDSK